MPNSPVVCSVCGREYKSERSFKCHVRYESNVACLLAWQKFIGVRDPVAVVVNPSPVLPQKRPIEEAEGSDENLPSDCSMDTPYVEESFDDGDESFDDGNGFKVTEPLESEEDEWKFPLIDDDSSCCTSDDGDDLEDSIVWSEGEESEVDETELCNDVIKFSYKDHRISPDTSTIIAGHTGDIAKFGDNLWWPESADLTKREYLEEFYEYCQYTSRHTIPMQGGFRACVELLCLLAEMP